ncbi:hypothetical protein [Veillonella sp. R32]|uniref:hypothetical protein n=1 Tax=Veillonella sp. R32 TaxID=2021312 RepID=UPI001389DA81|nr:hypothetical protein [Veillonella sp. R32]KAF1683492.1 hypothetical protein VER_01680 [Veillonella sp. R32]
MPFIMSRVNIHLSEAEKIEIKKRLGKAIERVPYKNEAFLMVGLEDDVTLFMGGQSDEPLAYIEVSVWKNESHEGYAPLTVEIAKSFHGVAKVPLENIYIRYIDIPSWARGSEYYE